MLPKIHILILVIFPLCVELVLTQVSAPKNKKKKSLEIRQNCVPEATKPYPDTDLDWLLLPENNPQKWYIPWISRFQKRNLYEIFHGGRSATTEEQLNSVNLTIELAISAAGYTANLTGFGDLYFQVSCLPHVGKETVPGILQDTQSTALHYATTIDCKRIPGLVTENFDSKGYTDNTETVLSTDNKVAILIGACDTGGNQYWYAMCLKKKLPTKVKEMFEKKLVELGLQF